MSLSEENRHEIQKLLGLVTVFALLYFLPVGQERFDRSLLESLHLAQWYAREHVLLCLVPAFFIAGAVGTFLSQGAVMKYLGARAPRVLAYGVASVSGTILAVCSCTVLPLFAGIYRLGAGLGPACSFLYSGPAINVMALVLTVQILGWKLGLARGLGAVLFAVLIGLSMNALFPEAINTEARPELLPIAEESVRPLHQTALQFGFLVLLLVAATWGNPGTTGGLLAQIYVIHWPIAAAAAVGLGLTLLTWFGASVPGVMGTAGAILATWFLIPGIPAVPFTVGVVGLALTLSRGGQELQKWLHQTWEFAWQILPLLLGGVLVAGFLLGRPGGEGLIPASWVQNAVGGESLRANFLASLAGAFMYFATLTEVPILQGLLKNGMGQGPALALLLAGPAVSLPNLLVIRSVLGNKKTLAFLTLVVGLATLSGYLYGNFIH
jgi:uncharacterized membrane protein YraQ (UPF0718 family)